MTEAYYDDPEFLRGLRPAARMASRTPATLWTGRLSMTDVALLQFGDEHLLDVGAERGAIHRAADDPWRHKAACPQAGSIDPELMIRMLIVGYCFGIRSERRLYDEVHLNLAHRWFCRLGPGGSGPRSLDLFEEPAWLLP